MCLLLGFFAVAVFAGNSEWHCDDLGGTYKDNGGKIDDACKYERMGAGKAVSLYVLEDPNDPNSGHKPGVDFDIYVENAIGSDAVDILYNGSSVDHSPMNVNSGATGNVKLAVYNKTPIKNVAFGALAEGQLTPNYIAIYNFYAPAVEFCADKACNKKVDAAYISSLNLKAGDEATFYVRLYIPYGPNYGKTDDSRKTPESPDVYDVFDFVTTGPSASKLIFMDTNGTKLTNDGGKTYHINIVNGMGAFKVTATSGITDGTTFSLNGFKHDGIYESEGPFPGSLEFQNPDFPPLDSALIFDSDGDGLGDSIVAYFRDLDPLTVNKFVYNWPSDGTQFPGDTAIDKNVIKLRGVDQFDPKGGIVPELQALVTSKLSGKSGSIKKTVEDRIGPVIETATLIKGSGSTDTLVIRFNKDIDESWEKGKGFLDIGGLAFDVTALKKNGDVWTYTLPKGTLSAGDSIKIAASCSASACPTGLIKTKGGISANPNNHYVQVRSSGRIYIDPEKNGFFDRDGNGTMDSAAITFEMPVTPDMLDNMDVNLVWLNSKGEPQKIAMKNLDSLVKAGVLNLSDDGMTLGVDLSSKSFDIKKMVTSVDTAAFKQDYGYVEIFNKELIDGKEVIDTIPPVYLNDKMSPVISSTFLSPESFLKMESDELVLNFSEPISDSLLDSELQNAFLFSEDGVSWKPLKFSSVQWNEDRTSVKIRMEAGENLKNRMNPADYIKLDPSFAGLTDKSGNGIAKNTPDVMMEGDPRVVMETSNMANLNYADKLSNNKDFTIAFKDPDFSLETEKGAGLGVLMDVSFSTIMKDSTGASAADMDLSKIGLSWELYVYTSLGAYVSSASGKTPCTDSHFGGNCFENPKQLYVRWNMRSKAGRKVGVGVYLARFKVKVYGAKETFEYERFYNWGVKAGKNGLDYGNLGE